MMRTNNYHVHIPHELVINILSRLPSASLLRLRFVCRSWYYLVTHDLDFRNLHFRNFNSNKAFRHWISVRRDPSTLKRSPEIHLIYRVFDETFSSKLDERRTVFRGERCDNPGFNRARSSCNGLTCFAYLTEFCFWNPSIRILIKRVHLSPIYDGHGYYCCDLFGFGFATNNSDHKVIIIKFMKSDYEEQHSKYTEYIHVYSLKTNSWYDIRSKPDNAAWKHSINNNHYGTYFNGTCHWMGVGAIPLKRQILCFDFDNDKFRCMDLPSDSCAYVYHACEFFVYKDMFALWDHCQEYNCNKLEHRLWIMKEYGSSKSWATLVRVVPTYDNVRYFNPAYIYGSTTNGRLLYSQDRGGESLMAYDIETKQVEKLQTSNVAGLVPYEDSLFLL